MRFAAITIAHKPAIRYDGRMNLHDIYHEGGPKALHAIAEKVGCNRWYLWQIATGRRFPSPQFAHKLVSADNRLTVEALYRDAKQ